MPSIDWWVQIAFGVLIGYVAVRIGFALWRRRP